MKSPNGSKPTENENANYAGNPEGGQSMNQDSSDLSESDPRGGCGDSEKAIHLGCSRSAETVSRTNWEQKQSGQRPDRLHARRTCGNRRAGPPDHSLMTGQRGVGGKGSCSTLSRIRVSKSCTTECEILRPDHATLYQQSHLSGYSSLYEEMLRSEEYDMFPLMEDEEAFDYRDDGPLSDSTILGVDNDESDAASDTSTISGDRLGICCGATKITPQNRSVQEIFSVTPGSSREGQIGAISADKKAQDREPTQKKSSHCSAGKKKSSQSIGTGRTWKGTEEDGNIRDSSSDDSDTSHPAELNGESLISQGSATPSLESEETDATRKDENYYELTAGESQSPGKEKNQNKMINADAKADSTHGVSNPNREELFTNMEAPSKGNFALLSCCLEQKSCLSSYSDAQTEEHADSQFVGQALTEKRVSYSRPNFKTQLDIVDEHAELLHRPTPSSSEMDTSVTIIKSPLKPPTDAEQTSCSSQLTARAAVCAKRAPLPSEIEEAVAKAAKDGQFELCKRSPAPTLEDEYLLKANECSSDVESCTGLNFRTYNNVDILDTFEKCEKGMTSALRAESPLISVLSFDTVKEMSKDSAYARRDHNDVYHGEKRYDGYNSVSRTPTPALTDSYASCAANNTVQDVTSKEVSEKNIYVNTVTNLLQDVNAFAALAIPNVQVNLRTEASIPSKEMFIDPSEKDQQKREMSLKDTSRGNGKKGTQPDSEAGTSAEPVTTPGTTAVGQSCERSELQAESRVEPITELTPSQPQMQTTGIVTRVLSANGFQSQNSGSRTNPLQNKGSRNSLIQDSSLPAQEYLSFLNVLRNKKLVKKGSTRFHGKLHKLKREQTTHKTATNKTMEGERCTDDKNMNRESAGNTTTNNKSTEGDNVMSETVSSPGYTPRFPRGHEVPKNWKPGEKASKAITDVTASGVPAKKSNSQRRKNRKSRRQRMQARWKKLPITGGNAAESENVGNSRRKQLRKSKSDSSVSPDRRGYDPESETSTDDEDNRDSVHTDKLSGANFEYKRKYYERLARRQKMRYAGDMNDEFDREPKRITSQVKLLKALDEYYSSHSAVEDEMEATYENQQTTMENEQFVSELNNCLTLYNYYASKLNHAHVFSSRQNIQGNLIRISKVRDNVPSTLDDERLKSLHLGDWQANPKHEIWDHNVQYAHRQDEEPGKPDKKFPILRKFVKKREQSENTTLSIVAQAVAQQIIDAENRLYIPHRSTPQISDMYSNTERSEKVEEASSVIEKPLASGATSTIAEPDAPKPQVLSYSDILKSTHKLKIQEAMDKDSVNGQDQRLGTGSPVRKSKSFDIFSGQSKSIPRMSRLENNVSQKLAALKERETTPTFGMQAPSTSADLDCNVSRSRRSFQRSEEDTWCYSVNAMLLRANRVSEECEFSRKNDHRFPRPDSAKVVSPVVARPSTFLSELLKQDRLERKQERGKQRLEKKIQEKLNRIWEEKKAELHKNNAAAHKPSRPPRGAVPAPNAFLPFSAPARTSTRLALPLASPKSVLLSRMPSGYRVDPRFKDEEKDNLSTTAGVLKIRTNASERAQERALRAHERNTDLASSESFYYEPPDDKYLPKKLPPLRIAKPIDFTNPSNRSLQRAPVKDIQAQLASGSQPTPTPPQLFHSVRVQHRPSAKRVASSFLLDQHSETLRYYSHPHMNQRKSSIVPLFSDSNNNATNPEEVNPEVEGGHTEGYEDGLEFSPVPNINSAPLNDHRSHRDRSNPSRDSIDDDDEGVDSEYRAWIQHPAFISENVSLSEYSTKQEQSGRTSTADFRLNDLDPQDLSMEPTSVSYCSDHLQEYVKLTDESEIPKGMKKNAVLSYREYPLNKTSMKIAVPSSELRINLPSQSVDNNGIQSLSSSVTGKTIESRRNQHYIHVDVRRKENNGGENIHDLAENIAPHDFLEAVLDYKTGGVSKYDRDYSQLGLDQSKLLQEYEQQADVAYKTSVIGEVQSGNFKTHYLDQWSPNYLDNSNKSVGHVSSQPELNQSRNNEDVSQSLMQIDESMATPPTSRIQTPSQLDHGQDVQADQEPNNEIAVEQTENTNFTNVKQNQTREMCSPATSVGKSMTCSTDRYLYLNPEDLEQLPRYDPMSGCVKYQPLSSRPGSGRQSRGLVELWDFDLFTVKGHTVTLAQKPRSGTKRTRTIYSARSTNRFSSLRQSLFCQNIQNISDATSQINGKSLHQACNFDNGYDQQNKVLHIHSIGHKNSRTKDSATPNVESHSPRKFKGEEGVPCKESQDKMMTETSKETNVTTASPIIPDSDVRVEHSNALEQTLDMKVFGQVFKDFEEEHWRCHNEDSRNFSWEKVKIPPSFPKDFDSKTNIAVTHAQSWKNVFDAASNSATRSISEVSLCPSNIADVDTATTEQGTAHRSSATAITEKLLPDKHDRLPVQQQRVHWASERSGTGNTCPSIEQTRVQRPHEQSSTQMMTTEPFQLSSISFSQPVGGPQITRQPITPETRITTGQLVSNSQSAFPSRSFLKTLRAPDLVYTIGIDKRRLLDSLKAVSRWQGYIPVFQVQSLRPVEMVPLVFTVNHCAPIDKDKRNAVYSGDVRSLPVFYTEDSGGFVESVYTVNCIDEGMYTLDDIKNEHNNTPNEDDLLMSHITIAKTGRLVNYSPWRSELAFESSRVFLLAEEVDTREKAQKILVDIHDRARGEGASKYFDLTFGWIPAFLCSDLPVILPPIEHHQRIAPTSQVSKYGEDSTGKSTLKSGGENDGPLPYIPRKESVGSPLVSHYNSPCDSKACTPRESHKSHPRLPDINASPGAIFRAQDTRSAMVCLLCGGNVHEDTPLTPAEHETNPNNRKRQGEWEVSETGLAVPKYYWPKPRVRKAKPKLERARPYSSHNDMRNTWEISQSGLDVQLSTWEISQSGLDVQLSSTPPFHRSSTNKERRPDRSQKQSSPLNELDESPPLEKKSKSLPGRLQEPTPDGSLPSSHLTSSKSLPYIRRGHWYSSEMNKPRLLKDPQRNIEENGQVEYTPFPATKTECVVSKKKEKTECVTESTHEEVGMLPLDGSAMQDVPQVTRSTPQLSVPSTSGLQSKTPLSKSRQTSIDTFPKTSSKHRQNSPETISITTLRPRQNSADKLRKTLSKNTQNTRDTPTRTARFDIAGWGWSSTLDTEDEEKRLLQKNTWSQAVIPPPFPTPKSKDKLQLFKPTKSDYAQHRRNLKQISSSYVSPYWTKKEVRHVRTPASDSGDDRSSSSRISTISGISSTSSSESESESSQEESESESGSSASGEEFFNRYADKGGPTSIDDIFKRTLPKQRLPHTLNLLKEAQEREEIEQLGYLRGREGTASPHADQGDAGLGKGKKQVTFSISEYDMCSDAEEIKELWKQCFPEVDFWDRNRRKKFKKTKIRS